MNDLALTFRDMIRHLITEDLILIASVAVMIATLFVVWLLLRGPRLWYWKVNDRGRDLKKIDERLRHLEFYLKIGKYRLPAEKTQVMGNSPSAEVVHEPVALEKPEVIEEPAAITEPVVADEPAAIIKPYVVEEPAAIVKQVAVEEPAVIVKSVAIGQSAVMEEDGKIQGTDQHEHQRTETKAEAIRTTQLEVCSGKSGRIYKREELEIQIRD